MTQLHPLADDYLRRLRRAGRRLPRHVLRDLSGEIEAHLAEATSLDMPEPEVRDALDRLGDPEDIVAAQRPPEGPRAAREWAAIFMLLFGGFVFGLGWIVGLILLWSSSAWSLRDKWIGTLIWPGGLAGGLIVAMASLLRVAKACTTISGTAIINANGGKIIHHVAAPHCTGGAGTGGEILTVAALVLLLVGPIATAVYLARRASGTSADARGVGVRPSAGFGG